MARAFSDRERAKARASLLAEGRRLFIGGGFKALSLSLLTDAAGIAKTSFYRFFDSKEELLLDLLADEAPGVSERVFAPLRNPDLSTRDALSDFLHALISEYGTNPFLARLIAEPQTLAAVATRVRAEDLERKAAWMERPLSEFLTARMDSGDIVRQRADGLIDLVRSVSLLTLHRDRYPSQRRFDAAVDALIGFVVDGITRQEGKP